MIKKLLDGRLFTAFICFCSPQITLKKLIDLPITKILAKVYSKKYV